MQHPFFRSFSRVLSCAAIGAAALLPAAASSAAPVAPAPATALAWRNIGPWIGGRVVAVAGVPSQPNRFYMGGVDGGIWESTDYGLYWHNITDGKFPVRSNSIGALAVAPSNPNVIYAGTGESDIRGDMITGEGMVKSTDGGKSWQSIGLRDTHTITGIAVDPRDANVVYASSMGHVFADNDERGVFKSVDGGKTWKKVLFVDGKTGAVAISMDPQHPNTLYAAMWQAYRTPWTLQSGGPGSAIYKTTDGGAHWTNVSRNPGFAGGVLGKMGVSVAASDPRVVYAVVQAKHGGVFRSDDGGAHWKLVDDKWNVRQRAFYYMSIYADPTNPNTVYVPEVDGLLVSRDGGRTFVPLHTPHGDNHIVWINPHDPKILLEGNDGGATVSTDGGTTWSTEWNQPTGQFYHVAIDDQFPFHVYGAQQDEGSMEGPSASDSGVITIADWKRVAYGESTFVAPQPGNPNITYGAGYFSIFLRHDARIGEYQSVSPWPLYQEGASSAELKYRLAWTHPILFSPADPRALYVGAQMVLRSDDHGRTWKELSPDLTRNDPKTEAPTGGPIDLDQTGAEIYPYIEALGLSPLDEKIIWTGSSDGLVHVTTDGGATWKAVTPPSLPQWAEITSIEPSHTEKGTAYLTASRYMWDDFRPFIYKTTDYGAHWSAMTAGIPRGEYVFAIKQDPSTPNLLLVGTRDGVYASYDGGAHFHSLSLNLPNVQVRDLAFDTREGEVAIATHGRAFWILDGLGLLEQLAKRDGEAAPAPALYAPQTAWLSHAYQGPDFPIPLSGPNPAYGATVYFALPSSYDGKTPATLTFADAAGHTVRRFSLHLRAHAAKPTPVQLAQMTPAQHKAMAEAALTAAAPGMNRFRWDLRYAPAAEVRGFWVPIAAGGLTDEVDGPTVVPGRYTVTLAYGGHTTSQSFDVALDPRIHTSAEDLDARLALAQKIHGTLDALDRTIDAAMTVRDRTHDRKAAAALDAEIGSLVQLKIASSEGPLIHEAELRSHLAYLAAEVDMAYVKPTAAQYAVYAQLANEADAGIAKLHALMAAAK